jgi:hypothetical protein
MEWTLNEPLSESLRSIFRKYLTRPDLEEIADQINVSWATMRNIRREDEPANVTEKNQECIIPMTKKAISNKNKKMEKLDREINAKRNIKTRLKREFKFIDRR